MDWIHPWIGLDWIGFGQDFQATLWIGLDPWVDGLDWVSKNGPMSNSVLILTFSRGRTGIYKFINHNVKETSINCAAVIGVIIKNRVTVIPSSPIQSMDWSNPCPTLGYSCLYFCFYHGQLYKCTALLSSSPCSMFLMCFLNMCYLLRK